MVYMPCRFRLFPYKLNITGHYPPYLRWLKHLGERLGFNNALHTWERAFSNHSDAFLMEMLSSGWHSAIPNESCSEDQLSGMIAEAFSQVDPQISDIQARNIIDNTPPIAQIRQLFSFETMEKEITAYQALHLRFDGLACLAESLIEQYGKQGELIIYDLMVESRLASVKGQSGSIEQFIENFTAKPDKPDLFMAGLEAQLIRKTAKEAIVHIRECEWARYFQERHPRVGYLMACSTDEVACKAFNQQLRLQRTQTIMEGGELCDFRIYGREEHPKSANRYI